MADPGPLKCANVTNKMLKIHVKNKFIFDLMFQALIWQIGRYLVSFFLPTFYKRIQVKNMQNVQVKGPVIIAMNHPNAFTDPLLFCFLYYPRKAYFLARGDAFKPGLITYLLESLLIVPIFRIQDAGKEGLGKNDESYQRVNELLGKNKKMIVFAEGLCIQERRLRPLKKGVARMVFGAYDALKTEELVVVPIGVNYSKPDKFRSNAFYNVGEPIPVKDFEADYKENAAKTYNKFLAALEPRMRELITHIEKPENDEIVYQVEELCKRDELIRQGLDFRNLDHDYQVLKQLTEKVNRAARTTPELIETFRPLAADYFKALKTHKLRDWLIDPVRNKRVNYLNLFFRVIILVAGFPIHLLALAVNYPLLALTHKLTKKIIKHVEFYSSIAIGIGIVLFSVYYAICFTVIYLLSPNVLWPLTICLILGLSGWFSLHYNPFFKKTSGMARILGKRELAKKLGAEREKLLSLINKF